MEIRTASLNVLADAYSHQFRAEVGDECVDWPFRFARAQEAIAAQDVDVLCLQEVDHHEAWLQWLQGEDMRYEARYVQRDGRPDGVLIAWKRERLELAPASDTQPAETEVHFDQLAAALSESWALRLKKANVGLVVRLRARTAEPVGSDPSSTASVAAPEQAPPLPTSMPPQEFVVACAHLHWNPRLEDIKLLQAAALMTTTMRMARVGGASSSAQGHVLPTIVCGDFNALPTSPVYALLAGICDGGDALVEFGIAAPTPDPDCEGSGGGEGDRDVHALRRAVLATPILSGQEGVGARGKDEKERADGSTSTGAGAGTVFLCDHALNRFCRWLRLLGIDTALESDEEHAQRTQNKNCTPLFRRIENERRVLLTTSKTMLQRSDCPPAFLIHTADLEGSLIALVREYSIELQRPDLQRCVKCNGLIGPVEHDDERVTRQARIGEQFPPAAAHHESNSSSGGGDDDVVDDDDDDDDRIVIPPGTDELFVCESCAQIYWWGSQENSSAARAERLAVSLYEKVCAALSSDSSADAADATATTTTGAGEEKVGEADNNADDAAAVVDPGETELERLQSEHTETTPDDSGVPAHALTFLDLVDIELLRMLMLPPTTDATAATTAGASTRPEAAELTSAEWGVQLRSAFRVAHQGAEAPVTNFTYAFRGTLDYTFVDASRISILDAAVVASTSDPTGDAAAAPAGPNAEWGSDHFMVTTRLQLFPTGQM